MGRVHGLLFIGSVCTVLLFEPIGALLLWWVLVYALGAKLRYI